MSNPVTPCETPPNREAEPTLVSTPAVGSTASDEVVNSWNEANAVTTHVTSNFCNVSSLDHNANTTSTTSSVSLTSASQMISAISHADVIPQDVNDSNAFMHSGIIHNADSTSGSLGMCEETSMIVDGPLQSAMSVSTIVSHEAISVSQDSDNSDEQMNVIDNISAENFIREHANLLNAATSVLHSDKTSSETDDVMSKSNISHNLMTSLEHHSVSSVHESEPMEIQNLLPDQTDLEEPVSSLSGYHMDHSQASNISVGNASQLDIGVNSTGDMRTNNLCLSSSSANSISDLSPGACISSGIGLPPVSTIIRSSAAKGRFDAFCRPSNINLIMGMPQFLNSSGSYDNTMSSIGAIQRITSDHCDALTAVSLASPLEDSSSRSNICADISMENVDVPLSSPLVCSTTSNDLSVSAINSRCIKPTSSVMSSLGPDIIDKENSLSEISASRIRQSGNLNIPSSPAFPGVIPIRDIINFGGPSASVSLLSNIRMEDIQKVAAINEHLRSNAAISTTLCENDVSLAHSIISSGFNCRDELQRTGTFIEHINHSSQALPILSAIETNVIMSTSSIDSGSKITNSDMKAIEASEEICSQQMQNLQTISHQELENSSMNSDLERGVSSRAPNIIYSTVHNILNSHNTSSSVPVLSTSKSSTNQALVSRSSIIERNIVPHLQKMKSESTSPVTSASEVICSHPISTSLNAKEERTMIIKSSNKQERRESLEESGRRNLSSVSPSAVTASVIQHLLKVETSSSPMKPSPHRISGGVITSLSSARAGQLSTATRESNLSISTTAKHELPSLKSGVSEELSSLALTGSENTQGRTLLVNVACNDSGKLSAVAINLDDDSLDNETCKTLDLSLNMESEKDTTTLPNLSCVALPSLFSNLSASAIASLQSSLKNSLPITLPASLPSVTIGGTATSVSLLSSFQPTLMSPPIPAVPSILLPSILSSSLRASMPGGKPLNSTTAFSSLTSSNAVYSGLLKSAGLSTVIKQEAQVGCGSGPLPPFTVVSGLPSLIKREFHANLASSFLNETNSDSQIPMVAVKQEPESTRSSTSASDYSASSILNANSVLPSIATVQIPTATPVELSVVVSASSTTAVPTLTSPVPSQSSTIAFGGNAVPTVSSSASTVLSSSGAVKDERNGNKKWNCSICKNGSPCGLHPIQSQGSSSSTASQTTATSITAPPPLMSGDPAKPFQCTLCGKHLASKNVYQLHLRSHSGEKPFTCNLCGHHFSQKTSLTRHMRSHTGERPFPCEACGKRFADKERIKIHMRTHTGEKPFACEVCGKRFSQKSTVKRHMSVHTGEKPFKCETCGKGFANRGNLNAHSKTHANT